jgi:hypothetical protein
MKLNFTQRLIVIVAANLPFATPITNRFLADRTGNTYHSVQKMTNQLKAKGVFVKTAKASAIPGNQAFRLSKAKWDKMNGVVGKKVSPAVEATSGATETKASSADSETPTPVEVKATTTNPEPSTRARNGCGGC